MGHHYVPQKLLQGFEIPGEPGLVWMFDKKQSSFKKVSIVSAAQEPKFYRDQVERDLANSVEGPANPAMDKLARRELLTIEEREQLSLYIVLMFTRGPRYRRKSTASLPEVLEKTVQEIKDCVTAAARLTNADASKVERIIAEIDRTRDKLSVQAPPEVVDRIRTPWTSERILGSIYEMAWHVVTTVPDRFFVTCDAPVQFFDSIGVGKTHSEFTFSISSTVAILGERQTRPFSITFHDAKPQMVKEINRRIISNAERFVFSPKKQDWIAKLGSKDPYLSRIAWT